MSLDCETPVGRAWIARQRETAARCAVAWRVDVMGTVEPCRVDAMLARDGCLLAVAEIKSRAMTFAQLQKHGTYLVTFEKLTAGRELAAQLCVPFLLVVGLLDAIVYWQISNADGEWCCLPITIDKTTTQATSNGGIADRTNAYIPANKRAGLHPIGVYPTCLPADASGEMLTARDIPF
jgi:hypothetical protein